MQRTRTPLPTPPRPERARRGSIVPAFAPVARALTLSEGQTPSTVALRDHIFRRALMLADVVATSLALLLAVGVLGPDRTSLASLALLPVTVVASKLLGLYDRDELRLRKSTLDEAPGLFQLAMVVTVGATIGQSAFFGGPLGGDQIAAVLVFCFSFIVLGRGVARRIAAALTPPERCLVVGLADARDELAAKLLAGKGVRAELVGELPLERDGGSETDLRRLERTLERIAVDRVLLAPPEADGDFTLDAIRLIKAAGVKVSVLPRLFEVVGSSVVFDDLDGTTVLGVRRFGLSRTSRVLKRSIDVAGALVGLLSVLPIGLLIAALIKWDSRGPVFFRQTRVGRGGREFRILKFRTMVDGAEAMKQDLRDRNEADGLFKIVEDPRITRVGRFLRRTSLDELPQLVNVLRGDMSLVGPRPLVVDEDRMVEGWQRRRLHLTPGMTGPWQVLGSSRIPLGEMVVIDYLYVANWSFFEDVKILLRTVLHMLARGGK